MKTAFNIPSTQELFESGAHYGHIKGRSHPKAKENVFSVINKVMIIDLDKTRQQIISALEFVKEKASQGNSFLFIGTKRQVKDLVEKNAKDLDIPYIANKWLGGMLTNFSTIKNNLKQLEELENEASQEEFKIKSKKYQSLVNHKINRFHKVLDGIKKMDKLPDVIIMIDTFNEQIALKEAKQFDIPVVGIADTNADPNLVDYPIVINDDAPKAVGLVLNLIKQAIAEGKKNVKYSADKQNQVVEI